MIALVEQMPADLAELTQIREQYPLALNRVGRDHEAEEILRSLIAERGPSSETYGVLGRVYKDRWEKATASGGCDRQVPARYRDSEYRNGFDADPTDVYPGINAVELMYLRDPDDPNLPELSDGRPLQREPQGPWPCHLLGVRHPAPARGDGPRPRKRAALVHRCARHPTDRMATQTTADSLRRLHRALTTDDADAGWVEELEQALRTAGRP
jgi:hypothetical protein